MNLRHKLIEKDKDSLSGVCLICGPTELREKNGVLYCKEGYLNGKRRKKKTFLAPDGEKFCAKCFTFKPLDNFYNCKRALDGKQSYCKACQNTAIGRLDPDTEYVCEICKQSCTGKYAHRDHNHITGSDRGILCLNCNFLLGHSKDNIKILENAVQYLKEYI
jgi:hypothetical protein